MEPKTLTDFVAAQQQPISSSNENNVNPAVLVVEDQQQQQEERPLLHLQVQVHEGFSLLGRHHQCSAVVSTTVVVRGEEITTGDQQPTEELEIGGGGATNNRNHRLSFRRALGIVDFDDIMADAIEIDTLNPPIDGGTSDRRVETTRNGMNSPATTTGEYNTKTPLAAHHVTCNN